MDPDRPSPLVLYRVAAQFFPGQWDGTEASIRDWMAVAAGLAIMAPDGHRPGLELGRALARARMSEASLERLLAARADTRRTLLLRAARFMAAKVERCDWAEAAFFLLGRTDDTIEAANRRVASAYYRELDTLEAKHK
jgi:CRISPR system Cascade subunit CasB